MYNYVLFLILLHGTISNRIMYRFMGQLEINLVSGGIQTLQAPHARQKAYLFHSQP